MCTSFYNDSQNAIHLIVIILSPMKHFVILLQSQNVESLTSCLYPGYSILNKKEAPESFQMNNYVYKSVGTIQSSQYQVFLNKLI